MSKIKKHANGIIRILLVVLTVLLLTSSTSDNGTIRDNDVKHYRKMPPNTACYMETTKKA